jgi:asparagine synthase (glutamine-hydrolysing)
MMARWMNELSLVSPEERYAHSLGFLRFTREAKEQLFTAEARGRIEDRDSLGKILAHFQADNADHLIDRMLYTDLMTRMPDHLLMTVDRMAMAHGLETRSPFVDYKLVEFAATIPGDLKLKGNRLKYLLRRLAERYMPRQVVHRPKVGFGFPLAHWMRGELRDFVHNMLGHSRFVEQGIFERSYLDRLVAEHMSGRVDHNYRLWLLINLEVWYRRNMEGLTVSEMQDEIGRLGAGRVPPSRLVAAPSPAP